MPDANEILKTATRLMTERFALRQTWLKERHDYRFRKIEPEVPEAYKDTNSVYMSPALDEEGKQVYALVEARPQAHIEPPSPELEPLTTLNEQWLSAGDIELDSVYGMCLEKSWYAQIHANIGWVYEAPRRNPYKDRPKAPKKDAPQEDKDDFDQSYERVKRESGIAAYIERRYVPTETAFPIGDVRNPKRFYEIKDVDNEELCATYGLTYDSGTFTLPKGEGTFPSGVNHEGKTGTTRVIEYWDATYMCILVANNNRGQKDSLKLDEWTHNFGRVPYFACPAWENETMDEHTKFSGPLDGLFAELPHFNDQMSMKKNVTYLRSYPSWQDVSKEDAGAIVDAEGNKVVSLKYQPGQIYTTQPGHEIKNIPMDASSDLLQDVLATAARMREYSLDPIARGISPGADTANSAISQLSRQQRSHLERLSKNRAHQCREIYKFRLKNLRKFGEKVWVFDDDGKEVGLSGPEVISLNVTVKYEPDTGTDKLIEEKQAAELTQVGLIPEIEFHERRGKENPGDFVLANAAERMRKQLEPVVMQQIITALGMMDAVNRMIQENAQSGDARNAVSGMVQEAAGMQNGEAPTTGMGSGSGGMPRTEGVRSPALQETTQPQMGY